MALGNRYTFTFQSLIDGEDFTILIKQEGYAGTVETLQYLPGRSPVVLSYDKNNSNLLHPIRGSQLTVNVSLTPTQIQEFVLAENRTWYVELTGANGFEWYGYLQPQPSTNYSPYGLRQLDLQFSDNLGSLQNTPDTILANSFIYLQSLAEMIERELSYTDISLPVTFATSVSHEDFAPDYIQDTVFLEQIMCNDFNGNQPQMAYDLLGKMVRMLQSTVYQKAGSWVVENWIDKSLAPYPVDLLANYEVLGRGLNVRFESPLSKVTARSYHYQIRHVISNRAFSLYIPTGPNKGFESWEQQGTLATEIFSLVSSGGVDYLGVLGNYVSSVGNSADDYQNDNIVSITAGDQMKLYLNYDNTFSGIGTVNPRIALRFTGQPSGNVYWMNNLNEWTLGSRIILQGDAEIQNALSVSTLAPEDGFATIQILRPDVPSLGVTYNSATSYIRFSYADFGAGKSVFDSDYKLFKSVGVKNNRGLRENEKFETIGLAFDNEFYPNATSNFENYICLLYDSTGTRLDGNFISDYNPISQPWGPTEFAANTYMRLFAKPQLYIEAELRGKGLNIGDVFTVDIPGLPTGLVFVVVAFDYDIKNDQYSTLLAYISYDATDTITMERVWLQQNQDDPESD